MDTAPPPLPLPPVNPDSSGNDKQCPVTFIIGPLCDDSDSDFGLADPRHPAHDFVETLPDVELAFADSDGLLVGQTEQEVFEPRLKTKTPEPHPGAPSPDPTFPHPHAEQHADASITEPKGGPSAKEASKACISRLPGDPSDPAQVVPWSPSSQSAHEGANVSETFPDGMIASPIEVRRAKEIADAEQKVIESFRSLPTCI